MRAVTKMSAMRGVVHVGILLGPILIVGVSSLVSGGLDGIEKEAHWKCAFDFHALIASAPSRTKTHTLLNLLMGCYVGWNRSV